jgi:hypothetical protein
VAGRRAGLVGRELDEGLAELLGRTEFLGPDRL